MANDVGSKDVSDIIYFSDMIAFDFKGKNGMTIDEVITHLHGLRKISENLPSLLEKLYAECNIKNVRIRLVDAAVSRIEIGSLNNWLNLGLEFMIMGEASEEDKKQVLEDIRSMSKKMKIGLLIAGVTIFAIGKGCSSSGGPMTNTQGIQQSFVVNIGTSVNLPPEKVEPVLNAVTKKPSGTMLQAAYDFVSPAKNHGGNIVFSKNSDSAGILPESYVRQVPRTYEKALPENHIEYLRNTASHIRALDMDNPSRGWGAVIPAVMPNHRFNIELDASIDRSSLLRTAITGDVEVTYQVRPDGSKKPVKIFLQSVN